MVSNVDMNSVLMQMRALAARAEGGALPNASASATNGLGATFKQALDQVNATQMRASEMSTALETGASQADIAEVMLALQKASLSFQAVVQVRNKMVAAYQEIMNMQV